LHNALPAWRPVRFALHAHNAPPRWRAPACYFDERNRYVNSTTKHDSFSLFGVFFGVVAAIIVFILLFTLAPIFSRMVGY